MKDYLAMAQRYRGRAKQLRAIAKSLDCQEKELLLQAAAEYEQMAVSAIQTAQPKKPDGVDVAKKP